MYQKRLMSFRRHVFSLSFRGSVLGGVIIGNEIILVWHWLAERLRRHRHLGGGGGGG
jgi:hypothetical protein